MSKYLDKEKVKRHIDMVKQNIAPITTMDREYFERLVDDGYFDACIETHDNSTNSEPELKPCPFCGEPPKIYVGSDFIACVNPYCQATTVLCDGIESWNKRVEHE